MLGTYVGVVADLLERRVIELAGVPAEAVKVVLVLDAGEVGAVGAALVHAVDPREVGLGALRGDVVLENDDVLAGDVGGVVAADGAGRSEGHEGREQEGQVLEGDHFGDQM